MNRPLTIICDLDGTLAIMNRDPFDYPRVGEDKLNYNVWNTVLGLRERGFKVIIMTGRDESCRPQTRAWLAEHGIEYEELFMRGLDDMRGDDTMKEEFYNSIKDKYKVMFVLEDRNKVVEMWRRIGIQCFQVQLGDF